jgi:hypothetical protein
MMNNCQAMFRMPLVRVAACLATLIALSGSASTAHAACTGGQILPVHDGAQVPADAPGFLWLPRVDAQDPQFSVGPDSVVLRHVASGEEVDVEVSSFLNDLQVITPAASLEPGATYELRVTDFCEDGAEIGSNAGERRFETSAPAEIPDTLGELVLGAPTRGPARVDRGGVTDIEAVRIPARLDLFDAAQRWSTLFFYQSWLRLPDAALPMNVGELEVWDDPLDQPGWTPPRGSQLLLFECDGDEAASATFPEGEYEFFVEAFLPGTDVELVAGPVGFTFDCGAPDGAVGFGEDVGADAGGDTGGDADAAGRRDASDAGADDVPATDTSADGCGCRSMPAAPVGLASLLMVSLLAVVGMRSRSTR